MMAPVPPARARAPYASIMTGRDFALELTAGKFPDVELREVGAPLCVRCWRTARALARARTRASSAQLGLLFSVLEAVMLPSRSLDFRESYRAASRILLVRFGSAADAPDARPPRPPKNHSVPLGERLSSYPQK